MVYLTRNISALITSQLNFFQLTTPKSTDRSYCSRIIKNIFIICQAREEGAERQGLSGAGLSPTQEPIREGAVVVLISCLAMKDLLWNQQRQQSVRGCNKAHWTGMFAPSEDNPSWPHLLPRISTTTRSWSGQRHNLIKTNKYQVGKVHMKTN